MCLLFMRLLLLLSLPFVPARNLAFDLALVVALALAIALAIALAVAAADVAVSVFCYCWRLLGMDIGCCRLLVLFGVCW